MVRQPIKDGLQWRNLEGAIRRARADAWARGGTSIEVDKAVDEAVRTLHPEMDEKDIKMILKKLKDDRA